MHSTVDPEDIQVAPLDGEIPDYAELKSGFESSINDAGDIFNQCRENRDTRYAVWSGQSSDGKKHGREGSDIDPTPWDGASDLQVFLVDEAINAKVALLCTALARANLVAVPIGAGMDSARAKVVTNFMRWLVYTQIPNLDREAELLANYIQEKGFGVTGQFWEVCEEKTLSIISRAQLEKEHPEEAVLLDNTELDGVFIDMFKAAYPDISDKKAKRMLKDLRTKGETTVPIIVHKYSRPYIRAFSLDKDIFIHPSATDIESAPRIDRVEYYSPVQLRSFVRNDGWNEAVVEAAIDKCIGHQITTIPEQTITPGTRTTVSNPDRFSELIGVVHSYQRRSDEDGVPGIYHYVFSPLLAPEDGVHDGLFKHGLLGYRHGKYPFTLHRREHTGRSIHESRGLPEVGKPFQSIVKACRDSRIDAASLSVLPPFMEPAGRPAKSIGPGARIPYRRDPGEYRFGDSPKHDLNTTVVEDKMVSNWREYVGVLSPEGDPSMATNKQRFEVGKFLNGWAESFDQVYSLYQQYGDDEVWFKVIGAGAEDMQRFEKGKPDERYGHYLTYDVTSSDYELTEKKLEMIAKIVATADRGGQVDYSELLRLMLESIDISVAEKILIPKEAATEKAVDEEKTALTRIAAGFDEDIKLGSPPQVGIGVIQQLVQSPDVQQRLQNDKPFADRLEKRMKQLQFQIAQQNNARIGRLGA